MTGREYLLRLAVDACKRGDPLRAEALISEALEHAVEVEALPHAETYAEFARRVDKEPRTVRAWVACGRLPSSCTIGRGRGRRVLVREALAALQQVPAGSAPEVAGEAYVARRRLRVVGGHA